jgi:hypothetical protein
MPAGDLSSADRKREFHLFHQTIFVRWMFTASPQVLTILRTRLAKHRRQDDISALCISFSYTDSLCRSLEHTIARGESVKGRSHPTGTGPLCLS